MSCLKNLWAESRVATLRKWWIYWGTYVLATRLGLKRSRTRKEMREGMRAELEERCRNELSR